MTFEQAKDQVAKGIDDCYFKNWQDLRFEASMEDWNLEPFLKMAAEIYATEAIKADRQRISQLCLSKASIHEGVSFSCPFDVELIHSLPIQL